MKGSIPYNVELERAALGCALLDTSCVPLLAAETDESYYFHPGCRNVFIAVLALHNEGKPFDAVLVNSKLGALGKLDECGELFVFDCITQAGNNPVMLPQYIEGLREWADKRKSDAKAQPEFNEWKAAQLFIARAKPICCVELQWYAYSKGTWTPTTRHEFRPVAQSVLPELARTERREQQILDHVEGAKQTMKSKLRGFYLMEGDAVLVNCANGVLRVTGETAVLLPHSPDYGFTLKTAASYDEGAQYERFKQTVRESLPDSADQALCQIFFGSLLLPDCRHEAALVCYGIAGAGKSTIAEAVVTALGPQLVTRLSMRQLCDPKGYHVPHLEHAAVNLGTEMDSLEVEDGGTFKALCSGESIQVRPIYGQPFAMQSTAKLVFLSNNLPRFKNGTDGELRRMRFLRFDRKPKQADPTLKAQLTAERDGILLYLVAGLMHALRSNGMPHGGSASQAALSRFAVSNDPLTSFIRERCEIDPHATEEKEHVRNAYTTFLEEYGLPTTLEASLFKQMYERFPNVKPSRARAEIGRKQVIVGLKLRDYDHN